MTDKESGFSFIWKIENFSMLPHQLGEYLESQTFVIDTNEKVDLFLILYPRGTKEKNYMAIFLGKKQEKDMKLNLSLKLESTEPSREITKTGTNLVLTKNGNGYNQFVSLSSLFTNKHLYLPQDILTLRCDISSARETHAESTVNKESDTTFLKKSYLSRTWIEVQRRSLTWSIRNIKKIAERLEEASITTPFLKLKLIPNKRNTPGDDNTQILIRKTSLTSKEGRLFVRCKLTLISAHAGKHSRFEESTHLFALDSSDVWTFPPFITTSMLMDKNNHFEDDTLILLCEFAFSYKENIHNLENNYIPLNFKTDMKKSQLSNCLENMYSEGKFCDIELKTGGETFPYYKLILCSRSPVFDAMFENNMREKNSNVVEINDVDDDTLQRMLTYMLSDVLEKEDLLLEDIDKLYSAADKYDIESLKQKCLALLISALSVESVCKILGFADDHQDGHLMTAACEFISSHTNEVLHSKQWEKLMDDHSKLTSKVMHQIMTGKYKVQMRYRPLPLATFFWRCFRMMNAFSGNPERTESD